MFKFIELSRLTFHFTLIVTSNGVITQYERSFIDRPLKDEVNRLLQELPCWECPF